LLNRFNDPAERARSMNAIPIPMSPANTTIRDVARLASVSPATVSNVLNGSRHVADGTRERVLKAVDVLGYSPHPAARSMRGGQSRLLGLIVADIMNPFFTELLHWVERAAHANSYSVLICNSDEDLEREQHHLHLLRSQRVDGILLAATGHSSKERAQALSRLRVPVVLVDRGFEEFGLDAVVLDNRRAALEAVRHLLAFGHRRIALIGGPLTLNTGAQRLAGYREGLLEAGLAIDPRWVHDAAFREQPAYDAACKLLRGRKRPTAILAANALIAMGVMRAITDSELSCPEDVSLVGIDDSPWVNAFRPRLTTVAQPVEQMAQAAVRLLLARLDGTASAECRTEVMAPTLIVRDSCSEAPGGKDRGRSG
jgi:LacI family transcriptional regulator